MGMGTLHHMGSSLSTMIYLAVLAIISVSGVLGKDSLTHHKYGDGDVISQNLTAVWEAIHHLEHQLHQLQDQTQSYRRGYGGHYNGGYRHEFMSLLHEVGIQQTRRYYMSPLITSTTQVKPEGGIKLRPAFNTAHLLYHKGHFTGVTFSNYAHDIIYTYNAGGSIAFHLIHPDGSHERKVLGDVQHDHHAQYVVIVPGGTWQASELIEGDFALVTFVSAPAPDHSLFAEYDVEDLVGEFPKYETMIRRLDAIGANDLQLNMPSHASRSHDHQGHQGHDHHDEHHGDHGSHRGLIGRNDGHDHHRGIIGRNDGHDQHHGITGHNNGHDHDDSHEDDDDSHEHGHP